MRTRQILVTAAAWVAAVAAGVIAENITYPDAAGVIDVTKAPYGADSTGKTDVTAVLQKAMDAVANGNRIVYLPNGTYLVSNTIKWPPSTEIGCGTCQKRTALQGQSRDGTIIRLKDNCAAFQDTASRKGVLWTGVKPAQRFRNSIWNLTVNTGRGNRGVSAIQYNTSNQGSIRHVKLVSEDRGGVAGLDIAFTDEIGPGFVDDLEVIGFDTGILAYLLNSLTLRNIRLSEQRVCGLDNFTHVISIDGISSTNSVPAIKNSGIMMLEDADLKGSAAALSSAAVTNTGTLYARNVVTAGYAKAIDNTKGTQQGAQGPTVQEFVSHPILSNFTSPAKSLTLPAKKPPQIAWDPLSDWASPMEFGAAGDGSTDDTRALQAAIDAGKHTVYLPGGKAFKFTEIVLRGAVRRVIGCQGNLRSGTIRFVDGTEPVVALENINALYYTIRVRHESSRTLIVRNCSAVNIVGAGSGDLFLEDICASPFLFEKSGQRIWAWQLNPEGALETNIVNRGAILWLMGLKTENAATKLATSAGGYTEVLGGHIYAQGAPKTTPLFTIENASASFAAVRQISFGGVYFPDVVRETRDGATKTMSMSSAGAAFALYTGYNAALATGGTTRALTASKIVSPQNPVLRISPERKARSAAGAILGGAARKCVVSGRTVKVTGAPR